MTREEYLEKMSCKIASYVYATAVLESGDANWFVYFDEIEKVFGVYNPNEEEECYCCLWKPLKEDKELVNAVVEKLFNYEGLDDGDAVWLEEDCFDINLFHNFRATYTDLDREDSWEEEE